MNYAGPFDLSHLSDAATDGTVGVDTIGTPASHASGAPTVIVNDANLLFSGDYKRSGLDLVLSKDGHDHTISDYFKGSLRAALSSPDGATLSPDLVKALVGEVQLAQLGGGVNAAAQVIGSVTKLTGSATAIRNGVSVMLNVGDNVQKGDVVQAGADSSLGLTFIDGTVFGLSSNARMVLNEMIYDPNGSSNSSLLSLVQGTITFVAGETAKHGDMRVDTPVATMGIRGTAVLVEIGFEVTGPNGVPVKFQVLVEPGGQVGSYFLYSKSNPTEIIGQVNQAGQVTSVTGTGDTSTGIADPLTPIAQAIIQQTLQQYFPNYVPNANPRSNGSGGGSAPADPNSGTSPDPLKFNLQPDGPPVTVPINLPGDSPTTPPINVTITRFNSAPTIVVAPVVVTLPVDKTSFDIKDQVHITDPDSGDVATPYVPGTAHIISASGPNGTPISLDLKSLIIVDPQTGHVSYDPALFKFLGAGQKAVYTIGFDSQSGPDTLHETLTFTVDGTNDAPVVAAPLTAVVVQGDDAQTIDLLAGATDPDLGETATLSITNIKFSVSGGTPTATAPFGLTLTGAMLHVDPSDPSFIALGAGQTKTVLVSYDVVDAQGAVVHQTETITITGTNDAPVIDADNTTYAADAVVGEGGVTAQGQIAFDDADIGDNHTPSVTSDTQTVGSLSFGAASATGGLGSNGTIAWTYQADPSAVAATLIASESGSFTDTFTVTISDGNGGTVTQTVEVTVQANVWQGPGEGSGFRLFVTTSDPEVAPANNWSDPENWTNGIPDETQFVLFDSSATINLDVIANVGSFLVAAGASVVLTTSGGAHTLNVAQEFVNYGDVRLAPGVTLHASDDMHNYGQLTIDNYSAGSTLLIDGDVKLDGGGTVTLDGTADRITGKYSYSTLSNIDNKIDGYGKIGDGHLTLVNAAGGIIAATDFWHGLTINTGNGTFTNDGLVVSASLFGGLEITGSIINNGTIEAHLGLLKVDGNVTGDGHAVIDGGILEFGGASNAHVQFSGNTADLLILDKPWQFTGTVTGFSLGDTIDLQGVSWRNVHLVDHGDTITVNYGTSSFTIEGDYDAKHFLVSTDFHGGTTITWVDQAPQIATDDLQICQHGSTTTISGLSMFDDDAGRRETFSYDITANGHTLDDGGGKIGTVNGDLAHGFTYTAQAGETVGKVAVHVTDGYGASDTVNFIFSTGNAPSTTPLALTGTAGKDVIIASNHTDTLTGGASADQFVFQTASGQHTIADFATGQDKIELDFAPDGNKAFQQWLACNATQQGADTLIKFGDTDASLLLKHVDLADLKASDFIHGGSAHGGYLLG